MPDQLTATVVIPTRDRPVYLDATLRSVAEQAREARAELLVVSDGPDAATERIARRFGARFLALLQQRGVNAARNAAIQAIGSEVIVFIDDDVEAPPGWLNALLQGVRQAPEVDVFGGPIAARLEGGGPRACGLEPPPITTLQLGAEDRDVPFVWGANMAIRRDAFERVGGFDETIFVRGDEEEWQRRYTGAGGRVRYLAGAGLVHRRSREDSRLDRLARAAYGHGRAARRYDAHKGAVPPLRLELRVLAGCVWHTIRRRCAFGVVMAAHTLGRLREATSHRAA